MENNVIIGIAIGAIGAGLMVSPLFLKRPLFTPNDGLIHLKLICGGMAVSFAGALVAGLR